MDSVGTWWSRLVGWDKGLGGGKGSAKGVYLCAGKGGGWKRKDEVRCSGLRRGNETCSQSAEMDRLSFLVFAPVLALEFLGAGSSWRANTAAVGLGSIYWSRGPFFPSSFGSRNISLLSTSCIFFPYSTTRIVLDCQSKSSPIGQVFEPPPSHPPRLTGSRSNMLGSGIAMQRGVPEPTSSSLVFWLSARSSSSVSRMRTRDLIIGYSRAVLPPKVRMGRP